LCPLWFFYHKDHKVEFICNLMIFNA
jgi:hypothetical protein